MADLLTPEMERWCREQTIYVLRDKLATPEAILTFGRIAFLKGRLAEAHHFEKTERCAELARAIDELEKP